MRRPAWGQIGKVLKGGERRKNLVGKPLTGQDHGRIDPFERTQLAEVLRG
jgi:hypothetical protein